MKNKIVGILLVCMLVVGLGVFGCAAPPEEEVFKIAIITGLTGGTATWGKQAQTMGQLIEDEIDAAGGITVGGKKVQVDFKYYDSESKAEVAATQTRKAIAEGCKIVMAGPQSAADFSASEICERAKVIYVNPYNVLDDLAERGYKYYFRTAGDIAVYVESAMDYLLWQEQQTGRKASKVAIFTNDNVVCSFGGKKFEELIPKMAPHWEIVGNVYYPADATDLTIFLLDMKAKGAELLLGAAYPVDSVLIARTLKELDYNLLAVHGVLGGNYDPEYGKSLQWMSIDTTVTAYFSPFLDIPGLAEFNQKYKARFGVDIPNNSANIACALTMVKDALERAGSTDIEALRKAMAETDFTKVAYEEGQWWYVIPEGCKFNEKGENIRQRGVTTKWVNPTTQKPIFPAAFAAEEQSWPRATWKQLEEKHS